MAATKTRPIYLRHGGVSLLAATSPDALPQVLHWGNDLGGLESERLLLISALTPPEVSDQINGVPSLTLLPDPLYLV